MSSSSPGTRRKPAPQRALTPTLLLSSFLALSSATGATYEVGEGKAFSSIGQVPWESLAPGDIVLIHWRTNAYHEKWVICRQGTPESPIVVRGVPGPGGELPVINGNGATTRAQLDFWNQQRAVIKIGGASVPPDTTPANTASYVANASAIYVEKGTNIVIRNCVLSDCGNGLFVAAATRNVLIEGNYIHSNGNEGSILEHNSYTAAEGIVFQFNRFGPLRTNCPGNALKDRSAGLVVRYNWIEGGNRQLDLVDAEDSVALQQSPLYRSTFVYGNVLIEPDNAGNSQIVHYGGDSTDEKIYRKGTLFFHHNTVVSTRSGNTTLFRLSTNDEYCDARNNIFYVTANGNRLALVDGAGRLFLTHNWLKTGYVNSHSGVTGSITNDGTNLSGAAPGFLALSRQEFRLNTNSACINAGTNLPPEALPAHLPAWHYVKHRKSASRANDLAPDLGAFEFSPFAAWQNAMFGAGMDDAAASEGADPDGDGVVNLLEYAFELDPSVFSTAGLPSARMVANGEAHFAIAFHRRPLPSELTYVVEVSADLIHWQPGPWYGDFDSMPSNAIASQVLSGGETIVRLNAGLFDDPWRFMRVRVVFEHPTLNIE